MASVAVSPSVSCNEVPPFPQYPQYPEPFRATTADLLAFRREVREYLEEVLSSVQRYHPHYALVRALQATLVQQLQVCLPWFADLTCYELERIVAEEEAAFLVWCAAEKAAWQQKDAVRKASRRTRQRTRRKVVAAAD